MSLNDNFKLDLSDIDWVFALWILLVILWNYGYPNAEPIYDVIVAIGGDGLIHQAGNILAGSDTALGIIPVGTGNDFARSLRLDSGELFEKTEKALLPAVKVDLIKCDSHFVATSVICGFPADVNLSANQLRFPKGSSSYTLATLMEMPLMSPSSYELKLDGEVSL